MDKEMFRPSDPMDLKKKQQVEVQLAEGDPAGKFDYNKDDTPVKESDHIIEDNQIHIDFSERNPQNNNAGQKMQQI